MTVYNKGLVRFFLGQARGIVRRLETHNKVSFSSRVCSIPVFSDEKRSQYKHTLADVFYTDVFSYQGTLIIDIARTNNWDGFVLRNNGTGDNDHEIDLRVYLSTKCFKEEALARFTVAKEISNCLIYDPAYSVTDESQLISLMNFAGSTSSLEYLTCDLQKFEEIDSGAVQSQVLAYLIAMEILIPQEWFSKISEMLKHRPLLEIAQIINVPIEILSKKIELDEEWSKPDSPFYLI